MLKVIRRHACRRCQGNLSVESDVYGVYVQCIQCGAVYTEKDVRDMLDRDRENAIQARAAAGTSIIR
jgi:hypothetical protein